MKYGKHKAHKGKHAHTGGHSKHHSQTHHDGHDHSQHNRAHELPADMFGKPNGSYGNGGEGNHFCSEDNCSY